MPAIASDTNRRATVPPATGVPPASGAVAASPLTSRSDESDDEPALEAGADGRPIKFGRAWYRFSFLLLPRADGPWVDLGCGNGEFLQLATRRGLVGFGVDIEPANVAVVRQLGQSGVVTDLEGGLPFRDGTLAGISLIECIEHVFEAERLLREAARVLRPGGWLLLTTPNVASMRYRFHALAGHPPKQEGYHRRFFTRALLTRLVEEAGFAIEARASYGSSALLSRIGRLRLGRPKYKYRFVVPAPLEALFAGHFVWRLRRVGDRGRS